MARLQVQMLLDGIKLLPELINLGILLFEGLETTGAPGADALQHAIDDGDIASDGNVTTESRCAGSAEGSAAAESPSAAPSTASVAIAVSASLRLLPARGLERWGGASTSALRTLAPAGMELLQVATILILSGPPESESRRSQEKRPTRSAQF